MLRTSLTDLLACRVPIQQAPMGVISTPELAVAVADAGGIGSVAAWGKSPDQLGPLLARMAGETAGLLSVNFAGAHPDPDAVRLAASQVALVDFFWFDPDPALVDLVHEGGALVCWQVGSLEEAHQAVAAGCDVVAVQGLEAGGHVRGTSALLPLLSAVVEEVDVPVLAAGGVADARALAAVLAAGAGGARIGTGFIATTESGAHPSYRAAIVAAEGRDTEITNAFALCPLCATSPRARTLTSAVEAVRSWQSESVGEIRSPAGSSAGPDRIRDAAHLEVHRSGRSDGDVRRHGRRLGA